MGQLATDNKQLIFIYSDESNLGKRLLPYIRSADKAVRLININEECIADTIWIEIAAMLNKDIGDLFDIDYLNSSSVNSNSEFNVADWLKIIDKTPSILQNPIAINGTTAQIIKEKREILSVYNTTGANFDKSTTAIKYANHKDTTGLKRAM